MHIEKHDHLIQIKTPNIAGTMLYVFKRIKYNITIINMHPHRMLDRSSEYIVKKCRFQQQPQIKSPFTFEWPSIRKEKYSVTHVGTHTHVNTAQSDTVP